MNGQPTQIGTYTIDRELGRGGMGVVYLGHDPALGRAVAIKAIPEEWASDVERMGRFEREARLLASMSHPGIAGVYGLHEHNGRRYLVMEFVEGRSLAEMLAETGAPPVDEALALGAQIAAAVEAAHEAGVVHRDLKPGNVMVAPNGKAKVLDFGLAKGTPAARSSMGVMSATPTVSMPTPAQNFSATQMGRVLGTVGYMSPEQARGKPVDRRTDIWSLGAVLYELLSGRRIFEGETQADTIAAILEREPNWSALPANTPPRVRELLARCLEKDVHRRLRDAGDARLEIEKALANREWTSSFVANASSFGLAPARGGGRRVWASALGGAVLLGAGVGIGALAWSRLGAGAPAAKADPVCFELTLNIPRTEREFGQSLLYARLSPDGKEVLCEFALPGARLAIHRFDTFHTQLLAGTDGGSNPVWSPDGQWVAFCGSPGTVSRVSREGGPVQVLVEEAPRARFLTWTTDGRLLIRGDGGLEILTVSQDGGKPTVWLKDFGGAAGIAGIDTMVQAPGENYLLAGAFFDNAIDTYNVKSIDLTTGAVEQVLARGAAPLAVAPDRLFFVRDSALYSAPFDIKARRVTGAERLLVSGVRTVDWGGSSTFDASPGGTFLYAPGKRGVLGRQLVKVDREGNVVSLGLERGPYADLLGVSRDGRWAAATTLQRRMEFWVIELATGARTLIDDTSEVYAAAFSPDGEKLIYTAMRPKEASDVARVMIWDRASGRSEPITPGGASRGVFWPSSWVSGQDAVLGNQTMDIGGTGSIGIMLLTLGAEPALTPMLEGSLAWVARASPNGQWMLFSAPEAGRQEVFASPIPPDGRRMRVSRDGGYGAYWDEAGNIVWTRRQEYFTATFSIVDGAAVVGAPRKLMAHPFGGATSVEELIPIAGGGFLTIEPSEQERNPAPVRVIMNWDGEPVK